MLFTSASTVCPIQFTLWGEKMTTIIIVLVLIKFAYDTYKLWGY